VGLSGCGLNPICYVGSGIDKTKNVIAGGARSIADTSKLVGAVVGLGAADVIGAATNFANTHISLSGVVCFGFCFGVEYQNGEFYTVSGGGDLVGASASIGYSSSTPSPDCGPSSVYGLGPAGFTTGPDGAYSFGYGPGLLFGHGQLYTSSPWP
jgi:hypothetical protein